MRKPRKIPHFKSERQEAEFWDKHDFTEFFNEKDFKTVSVSFPKPKRKLVSIRVDEGHLAAIKRLAAYKGIGYLTLMRMWIAEKANEEVKHLKRTV